MFSAALIGSITLIAWHDQPGWLWPVGLAGLLVLALVVWKPNALLKAMNRVFERVGRETIDVELTPRDMLGMLWPYAANWVLFGFMSYALIASLYPSLPTTHLPAIIGLSVAASLGAYLVVLVPQGLGVRELFIVALLVGFVGIPEPVAAASAVLARGASIVGTVAWAAVSTRL